MRMAGANQTGVVKPSTGIGAIHKDRPRPAVTCSTVTQLTKIIPSPAKDSSRAARNSAIVLNSTCDDMNVALQTNHVLGSQ